MVIRVKLMFRNLICKLKSNAPFRHFFAHPWIKLAHLGSLHDLVTVLIEILGSLYSSTPCGRPHFERPHFITCFTLLTHGSLFALSVRQKTFSHFLSIVLSLLRKRGVCFVRVCFLRNSSLTKISSQFLLRSFEASLTRAK